MNKEDIISLADKLYINLTDEEINDFYEEFDYITESVNNICNIEGISDVPPMHMVTYKDKVELRNDEVVKTITKEEVLKNSKDVIEDNIRVPKVVE